MKLIMITIIMVIIIIMIMIIIINSSAQTCRSVQVKIVLFFHDNSNHYNICSEQYFTECIGEWAGG